MMTFGGFLLVVMVEIEAEYVILKIWKFLSFLRAGNFISFLDLNFLVTIGTIPFLRNGVGKSCLLG